MKKGTLSLTSEKGDEDHGKKIFEDIFVYHVLVFSSCSCILFGERIYIVYSNKKSCSGFSHSHGSSQEAFYRHWAVSGRQWLIPAEILANDLTRDIPWMPEPGGLSSTAKLLKRDFSLLAEWSFCQNVVPITALQEKPFGIGCITYSEAQILLYSLKGFCIGGLWKTGQCRDKVKQESWIPFQITTPFSFPWWWARQMFLLENSFIHIFIWMFA